MKRFAVAILSFWDNDNKIFIVEAENEVTAVKKGMVEYSSEDGTKKETEDWCESLPNDLDRLSDNLLQGDFSVAVKEI